MAPKLSVVTSVKSSESRILEWLDRESKFFVILVAILLDVLIGVLDHLTGYEISFGLFYIIPVALVSRCTGRTEGIVICLICSVTWLVADLTSGHEYSHYLIPYWNALVRLGFFVVVSLSLASMRCSMQALEDLSRTDALTGAANARAFYERAQMEIDRSLRHGRAITIAYLDLDDFKAINDRYGHTVGDQLLVKVAERTAQTIRKTDLLGRLGGDEFVILFPETGPKMISRIMGRVKDVLSQEMRTKGWLVTFSVGVATFMVPPGSVDEMIKTADDLMYMAKSRGKDTLTFATVPHTQSSGSPNKSRNTH